MEDGVAPFYICHFTSSIKGYYKIKKTYNFKF
jgi:hypothetical protein